jgi:ubiquinone/menaquinone biosynthesis C-methylase UbiE
MLGILRSLQPENLLDIGSGRGTFLWRLLADFPGLPVTAAEIADRRSSDLAAVRKGGVQRLTVVGADVHRLPFAPRSFDVVTMLEVVEHFSRSATGVERRTPLGTPDCCGKCSIDPR